MKAALYLFLIFLTACTHTIELRQLTVNSRSGERFKGKSVALVINAESVPDEISTNTDVYTFKFQNAKQGVSQALRTILKAKGSEKVDIVSEIDSAKAYDFYIKPRLEMRSVHDFWTMGCLLKFNIEITSREQRILANQSSQGKKNFFSANQADEKCRGVLNEILSKTTEQAIRSI